MRTTPVEDITVKQIVARCGTTRQTFYRHFIDRNDLIHWYFDKLLHESFHQMGSGDTIYDGLIKKLAYIREERLFFTAAFQTDEQNNLREYDYQMIFSFYQNLILHKTGHPASGEINELLDMYCQASVYKTVQWVLGGMKQSEHEIARILVDAMPQKLSILFSNLGLLG